MVLEKERSFVANMISLYKNYYWLILHPWEDIYVFVLIDECATLISLVQWIWLQKSTDCRRKVVNENDTKKA